MSQNKLTFGTIVCAFLWVIAILCAGIGAFILIGGVLNANGAPQEASAAAMAAAIAIIPYCIARGADELRKL